MQLPPTASEVGDPWGAHMADYRWPSSAPSRQLERDPLAVEEIHDAGFERVLRPDDEHTLLADQLLEHRRAVPQMIDGRADVGPHCLLHELLHVLPRGACQQSFHRRPHSVHDGVQVGRLALARHAQLFDRRTDGPTLRVPQHDRQPGPEACGCELHTADLRRRHDIAGDANHEQIAQALIEHDLRGHARIGAPQDDRKGLLPRGQLGAARVTDEGVGVAGVREEAAIALAQPAQRFVSGDQPQAAASGCSWP